MAYLFASHDAVTSLVDFHGFNDRPAETAQDPEAMLHQEVSRMAGRRCGNRIVPYVQMHEFEGLLFSNVGAFSSVFETTPNSLNSLQGIRAQFATPECINDHRETTPSRRIGAVIPEFRKRLHGPIIAKDIGLAIKFGVSVRDLMSG